MPAAVQITPFRWRQLKRILDLEAASFPRDPYPRELFRELFEHCGDLFLVAKCSGRIAGYMVTAIEKQGAEIISIAVFPAFREKGIGSALMHATQRKLKRRGIASMALMVRIKNASAIRFYQRFGFRRMRRVNGYYEDGGDAWRMRLQPPAK